VAILGRYLFGNRWQTSLSRRLGISRQIIVAWAGYKRPVSQKYSLQIAEMVGLVHGNRRTRERFSYIAMIESLESESARSLMLDMLAAEVEVRVQAISILARNGSSEVARLSQRPK